MAKSASLGLLAALLTVCTAEQARVRPSFNRPVLSGGSVPGTQPAIRLRGGNSIVPAAELVAQCKQKTSPPADVNTQRGLIGLLGGVMIHLACGSMYCWGNLVSYLPPELKYWNGAAGTGLPDAQLVLPLILVSQMTGMPFGPVFEKLMGPTLTAALGAILMGAGVIGAANAKTLGAFVISYAVLFGLGVGITYQMPFITGNRWFPTKKGMVTGSVITGMGASAFIFNMLATKLVNPEGLNAVGGVFPSSVYANWPSTIRTLGCIYLGLALTGGLLQANPPSFTGKYPLLEWLKGSKHSVSPKASADLIAQRLPPAEMSAGEREQGWEVSEQDAADMSAQQSLLDLPRHQQERVVEEGPGERQQYRRRQRHEAMQADKAQERSSSPQTATKKGKAKGAKRRRGSLVLSEAGTHVSSSSQPSSQLVTDSGSQTQSYTFMPTQEIRLSAPLSVADEAEELMIATPPAEQALKVLSRKAQPTEVTTDGPSLVSLVFAPKFACMWLMILFSAVSGINIAGSYKTYGLKQPQLNSDAFLSFVGSLSAIGGNAAGRFFFGAMSDVVGFKNTFVPLTLLQATMMLSYEKLAANRLTFCLATVAMLFCMGGNFALFPAQTMREYGASGASVYSILFTAFGSAALLGPLIGNALLAKGGFGLVFTVLGLLSFLSTALAVLVF